jgi:hypothetical protein
MGDVSASEEVLPATGHGKAPRGYVPAEPGPRRLPAWAVAAVWLAGAVAAFTVYLLLARTRAVNSDGAGNALQAWDMLHGNPLLRGWVLSDVSFYTTELPQYMLVELFRGLNQDVVHVAAAMTYVLAMLLAALLAKGDARGREALVRAAAAAGIMLAPQLVSGTNVLLSSPDHIGTSVPVMVAWLILDRARPRWYVPVVVGALLGWATIADTLVLFIGVLPVALVCAVRAYRAVIIDREPMAAQWYSAALGGAAVLGGVAGPLVLHIIHTNGGFFVSAPTAQFASGTTIVTHNLGITGEGLLLLGGADFLGLRLTPGTAFLVLHVVGVFLAAWGTWLAARRFLRDRDLVVQLLVAGVVIVLASYVLGTKAQSLPSAREIDIVLPFSAALAGRLLAGRLMTARLVPVLAVVLAGYLAGLAHEISQPAVPAQDQQLTSWLEARHLHTGLSGYWESNVVTLTSGDQVRVRVVSIARGRVAPGTLETDQAWYDPSRYSANFVVLFPGIPGYPGFTSEAPVLATFGKPARTYDVGAYRVLVWNKNLLRELR